MTLDEKDFKECNDIIASYRKEGADKERAKIVGIIKKKYPNSLVGQDIIKEIESKK